MNNRQIQNVNKKIYKRLVSFILISTACAFIVFFLLVYLIFPALMVRIPLSSSWDKFDIFSSLISMSLLAGSIIFALKEYTDAEKAKEDAEKAKQAEKAKLSYEIYNAIFDKLTDPEQEAARRWILLNIHIKKDNEELATWYENTNKRIMFCEEGKSGLPEGQNAIKMTLNCLDYIGFIAKHYWEVEKDSLDWISAPIAKIWRRIGPYVLHVRELRKTSDYYLFAEYIGNLCIDYRTSKHMQDEEIAQQTP